MSHPYRTVARIDDIRQGPVPANRWRRYRVGRFVLSLTRRSLLLALAWAFIQGDRAGLYGFLSVYPFLMVFVLPLVTHAKCPFCAREIAKGPAQKSYWPILLGVYPDSCTHCGAPVGATEYQQDAGVPTSIPGPSIPPRKKLRRRRRDPSGKCLATQVLRSLDR